MIHYYVDKPLNKTSEKSLSIGNPFVSPLFLSHLKKQFGVALGEIKKIKKLQKRPDGIFGSFMTRPVSHVVAYYADKMQLTPNMVSILSMIFCLLAVVPLFISNGSYFLLVLSVLFWWAAAIFDAADGDLARYSGAASDFGKWLDSFLDRIKEFLIFSVFAYLAYKNNNENILYLLLGFAAIFSNVMSGYVSDTKKQFIKERAPVAVISKKYILGMVDTRDFVVILSILLNDFRIGVICYSTIFLGAFIMQTVLFASKYYNENRI